MTWHVRQRKALAWSTIISLVLLTSAVRGQAVTASAPSNVSVRERLLTAARVSQALADKGSELSANLDKRYQMESPVPEDRALKITKQYARESQTRAYIKARPWEGVYAHGRGMPPPEIWPTAADAGALRKLLADEDAVVRSLAVEALATLLLPEDAGRIGALLDDTAPGAVALAWAQFTVAVAMYPNEMVQPREKDPINSKRMWRPRTVQTYAREALKLMTGLRFDGKEPPGQTFAQWWKTHDLGQESLWYWQQRLTVEREAMVPAELPVGEKTGDEIGDPLQRALSEQALSDAYWKATREYRAKLQAATVKELAAAAPEVQVKVLLLAHDQSSDVDMAGPVNRLIPEVMSLRIGVPRLVALAEGKDVWPDVDVGGGRSMLLLRIAQVAPGMLRGVDRAADYAGRLQAVLEKDAAGTWWMPVMVSRLLPAAADARQMEDPKTRDGYLRQAVANSRGGDDTVAIEAVREMVRTNLEGQWPVLETLFYQERIGGVDYRQAILQTLGEAPHTKAKAKALADWIKDPRNEAILTQPNRVMGMDMYRVYAIMALNEIGGEDYIPYNMRTELAVPEKSKALLVELRRLAEALVGKL